MNLSPQHGSKIDALSEREAFSSYIYRSWEEAAHELQKRDTDEQLRTYVSAQLPQGLPEPMKGKKSMVLFRHIATSNYEVNRFVIAADALASLSLAPLILEYTNDKFTNRNEWKFSLAKLRFHKGTNKLGDAIVETKNIIDVNESNNKPLSSLQTHWGQSLIEFHHELYEMSFPHMKDTYYDLSEWLHEFGGSAKDYYKSFLTLFLQDGILFENFLLDTNELSFTREIILPALLEIEAETGFKPLIVALEPTHIEGNAFWLSHPIDKMLHLKSKTASS